MIIVFAAHHFRAFKFKTDFLSLTEDVPTWETVEIISPGRVKL